MATVDQRRFAATLVEQRMLLLGGTRFIERAQGAATAEFRDRLEAARQQMRLRAMAFSALTGRLTQRLEDAGIPAVPLKGATLAAELYGDEAMREYADIDILVPADDLERAVRITRALGWTEADHSHGALPPLHRVLVDPAGSLPGVELHWRIHWYESAFAGAAVARSRRVEGIRRLAPADQLAALLLFYARDGFAGLRLAADIGAWWDRHGSEAALADLASLATRHPALAESWRAALTVAAQVTGVCGGSVPAELRTRTRGGALAARLANWDLRADPDQIMANVSLVDGLLTPPGTYRELAQRTWSRPQATVQSSPDSRTSPLRELLPRSTDSAKTLVRSAFALAWVRWRPAWSPMPASVVAITPAPVPRQSGSLEPKLGAGGPRDTALRSIP